jgi:hypothetical protein
LPLRSAAAFRCGSTGKKITQGCPHFLPASAWLKK